MRIKGSTEKYFEGLRLDNGSNRTSQMSELPYLYYSDYLSMVPKVRSTASSVLVIGGIRKESGISMIPAPFEMLYLIIDEEFLIIPADIPTLLSTKDMIFKVLYRLIKNRPGSFGNIKQPL